MLDWRPRDGKCRLLLWGLEEVKVLNLISSYSINYVMQSCKLQIVLKSHVFKCELLSYSLVRTTGQNHYYFKKVFVTSSSYHSVGRRTEGLQLNSTYASFWQIIVIKLLTSGCSVVVRAAGTVQVSGTCFVKLCIYSNFYLAGGHALQFEAAPQQFIRAAIGFNLHINCTTNDPQASVKLMHSAGFGAPFTEKPVTPNKLSKANQTFTVINIGISDGGVYKCWASDGNNTIEWPQGYGFVFIVPSMWSLSFL